PTAIQLRWRNWMKTIARAFSRLRHVVRAGRRGKSYRKSSGSHQRKKLKRAGIRLPPRPHAEPIHYLSIAAIAKNEGCYLREWIEFQRLMGVEQVYLYDNGSTDDSAQIIKPYLDDKFLTLIPWATFDSDVNPQRQAYAHALCNFGLHFRWMAFI